MKRNVHKLLNNIIKVCTSVAFVILLFSLAIFVSSVFNTMTTIETNTELYNSDMRCESVDSFEIKDNIYTIVTDKETYTFDEDKINAVIYRNTEDRTAHYLIQDTDTNYLLIPLNNLYKEILYVTGYFPLLIFSGITVLFTVKLAVFDKLYKHPKMMIILSSVLFGLYAMSGVLCFFAL